VATDIRLTAAWVTAALADVRGTLASGDETREFGGVSIDTRTLAPGELFIAVRGDRFDGADFALAAIAAGAGGVMVPRERGPACRASASADHRPDTAVIEVDDATVGLQHLARAVRRESGTTVVAITGSAGKTTTKEVTSEFLSTRYRVVRNHGNFNNHIGLPLSLIELRQRPEIAVVELGMNHPGEISTLVAVAEPQVRVWTNVADAHMGFFASLDAIADAKAEILEGATASSLLVANADDERIAARIGRFAGRVVTFGRAPEADVRASAIVERGVAGTSARVSTPRGHFDVTTPLVGLGHLANVLAATAVAVEFDVPLALIAETAATLRPAARRGEVVRLAGGVTVIDDSYNANPTATRYALDVLARSQTARRIAVLGEMLELGDHALALHETVGRAVPRAGVAVLLTVGGAPAAALAAAAVAAGMAAADVRHFATSEEAAEAAVAIVGDGDLVLVKGSRGIRTDRVVDRLRAERA
jgi:UDP-N-acetylmuramoyl-tripeptide--D-alanyl-D-alanine ligase